MPLVGSARRPRSPTPAKVPTWRSPGPTTRQPPKRSPRWSCRSGHKLSRAGLDLEDQSSITRTLEIVSKRFDGLDVLVANAVRWPTDAGGPLRDVSWNAWQRAVRTNIEGTTDTLRNALPHLAASNAGRVVLVSSGVAREGMPGASAYATSKAALEGLCAALKWETAAAGTLANIVSPGFTETENNLARFGDDVRQSVRTHSHWHPLHPRGRRGGRLVPRIARQRQHHRCLPARGRRDQLTTDPAACHDGEVLILAAKHLRPARSLSLIHI